MFVRGHPEAGDVSRADVPRGGTAWQAVELGPSPFLSLPPGQKPSCHIRTWPEPFSRPPSSTGLPSLPPTPCATAALAPSS